MDQRITVAYAGAEKQCDASAYAEKPQGVFITEGRFTTFIPLHSIRYIVTEIVMKEVK